jgi:hypothetical protein
MLDTGTISVFLEYWNRQCKWLDSLVYINLTAEHDCCLLGPQTPHKARLRVEGSAPS